MKKQEIEAKKHTNIISELIQTHQGKSNHFQRFSQFRTKYLTITGIFARFITSMLCPQNGLKDFADKNINTIDRTIYHTPATPPRIKNQNI